MWSCFWKRGWNVLVFKFVIFLRVQISLEKEVDLILLRGPLRLTTTAGCILSGDSLTVSWSIYLQSYQRSNVSARMLQHPSSITCFALPFGSIMANKVEGNTSNSFSILLLLPEKLLAGRRGPAGSFC